MQIKEKVYSIDVPKDVIKSLIFELDLASPQMIFDQKDGNFDFKVIDFQIFESDTIHAKLKIFYNQAKIDYKLNEKHLNHEFLKDYINERPSFKVWIEKNEINEAFIQVLHDEISFSDQTKENALYFLLENYEINKNLVENFIENFFDPERSKFILNYKLNEKIFLDIEKKLPEEILEEYKILYLDELYDWERILNQGNFIKILDLYNKAKNSESEKQHEVIQSIIKNNNINSDLQSQIILYYYNDVCNSHFSYDKELTINQILQLKNCPFEVFSENYEFEGCQLVILKNKNAPVKILEKIAEKCNNDLLEEITKHPNCSEELLSTISLKLKDFEKITKEINPNKIEKLLTNLSELNYSNEEKLNILKILIEKETCFPQTISKIYNKIGKIRCKDKDLLNIIMNNTNTPTEIKEEIFNSSSGTKQYRLLSNLSDQDELISFAKNEIKNLNINNIPLNNYLFSFNTLPHSLRTLFFNKESSTLQKDIEGNLIINKDNLNKESLYKINNFLKNKIYTLFVDISVSDDYDQITNLYNILQNDNKFFELFELEKNEQKKLFKNIKQNQFTSMEIIRDLSI